MTTARPTVTVLVPTYREEGAIDACLAAVEAQTYPAVVEVLVVDGRSDDATRERAAAHPGVRVLDNPGRMQSAALNVGLAAAAGEVVVRVDGHCRIAPDYVERCVAALEATGAAMVGGAMTPEATGAGAEGIAAAMASRVGAGPARFHVGGGAGWVDTVYLGAFRTELARRVGGYATDVGVNEDAEMAHRLGAHGGVWFDPAIRSTYTPRASLKAVGRQFYRYGLSRAATAKRHPRSVRPRQLVAPALVLGLALPRTRAACAVAYAGAVAAATVGVARRRPSAAPTYAAALPVMHLAWGTGFLAGLAGAVPPRPVDPAES